jgi:hypothetical protein
MTPRSGLTAPLTVALAVLILAGLVAWFAASCAAAVHWGRAVAEDGRME